MNLINSIINQSLNQVQKQRERQNKKQNSDSKERLPPQEIQQGDLYLLKDLLNNLNFKSKYQCQKSDINNQQYYYCQNLIQLHTKNFSLYEQLQINNSLYFKHVYFLIRNGGVFSVKEKRTKILFCRLFNKLNGKNHLGSWQINTTNGLITFTIFYNMTKYRVKRICLAQKNKKEKQAIQFLQRFLTSVKNQAVERVNKALENILLAANVETDNTFQQLKRKKSQVYDCFQFNKFNSLDLSTEYDKKLVKKKQNSGKNIETSNDNNLDKNLLQIRKIIEFYESKRQAKKHLWNQEDFSDEIRGRFNKHFIQTVVKSMNSVQNLSIMNEIIIIQGQKIIWKTIYENQRNIIQIGRVEFFYKLDNHGNLTKQIQSNLLNKILVRKYQKNLNEGGVARQKNILEIIAKKTNAYVGKYYFSTQKDYKNALFGDYYGPRDFRIYMIENSRTISLFTIFHIMSSIIQGLRFLLDSDIMHMDLKPENIMISKGVNVRIIDYNSAQTTDSLKQSKEIGYTIPYAAPEIFGKQKITAKADIYSLMVIIYEILYGTIPKQYHQTQYKLNKLFLLPPESTKSVGPIQLMNVFSRVLLGGLNCKDPASRPNLNWILPLCRQSIYLLDRIY